jgi:hypothetical protein
MQTIGEGAGGLDQGPPPLYTPEQLARLRPILARSPLYTFQDYFLLIVVQSSVVGATVSFGVRFVDLEGNRRVNSFTVHPAADRSSFLQDVYLGEGLLFSVECSVGGAAVDVGAVWVEVILEQNSGAQRTGISTLFSGYPTSIQFLSWPYVTTPPQERPGVFKALLGTAPGAGSNILVTVPTGARWELEAVFFALTAGVAPANRLVQLALTSAGRAYYVVTPLTAITAGNTGNYQFAPTVPFSTVVSGTLTLQTAPLGFLPVLYGGDTFGTGIINDTLDNTFGAPIFLVRETLRQN